MQLEFIIPKQFVLLIIINTDSNMKISKLYVSSLIIITIDYFMLMIWKNLNVTIFYTKTNTNKFV